jgi:hypothetical protein
MRTTIGSSCQYGVVPGQSRGAEVASFRLTDLARAIGMPRVTLFCWLQRGWLTARQQPDPPRLWIVRADPDEVQRLRQLHQLPRGHHVRRPWLEGQDTTTTPGQEGAPDDADPSQL